MLVKDIQPGALDSSPEKFLALGSTVLFVADDGVSGVELWKSNGTAAGTVMVEEIVPGADGISLEESVAFGGVALLALNDNVVGTELWRSDGTAAGTSLLLDIDPGPDEGYPSDFFTFGSTLLFQASTSATGGELWRTDGTAAGTFLVRDIRPGTSGSGVFALGVGGGFALLSVARASSTRALAHQRHLRRHDLPVRSDGGRLAELALRPDRFGRDPGLRRRKRPPRSRAVEEHRHGGDHRHPARHRPGGRQLRPGRVHGLQQPDLLLGLWCRRQRAVEEDDQRCPARRGHPPGERQLLAARSRRHRRGTLLLRLHRRSRLRELWRSGGAAGDTDFVVDLDPGASSGGASSIAASGAFGNGVVFGAFTAAGGGALFTSDGTTGGTDPVVDLDPGTGSNSPGDFFPSATVLFMSGDTPAAGIEPWVVIDAGIGGYLPVSLGNLNPGAADSRPRDFIAVGGTIYFTAEEPTHGRELWKTGGNAATTVLLKDIQVGVGESLPDQLTAFDGRLFFRSCTVASGCELWVSDGSAAGTQLFKDLAPGSDSGNPKHLTVVGDDLWFSACDAATGCELLGERRYRRPHQESGGHPARLRLLQPGQRPLAHRRGPLRGERRPALLRGRRRHRRRALGDAGPPVRRRLRERQYGRLVGDHALTRRRSEKGAASILQNSRALDRPDERLRAAKPRERIAAGRRAVAFALLSLL